MFIVKLILVPLWPFFITNWGMKKFGQEFSIKGYLANLILWYGLLLGAVYGVLTVFTGGRPEPEKQSAPTAEVTPAGEAK